MAVVGFVLLVALAFGLTRVLSGRAAYIHVGATMGTIMMANVWNLILPTQRRMIAAIGKGERLEPALEDQAMLRTKHNTYLSVPLVLVMLSNHFPTDRPTATRGTGRCWASSCCWASAAPTSCGGSRGSAARAGSRSRRGASCGPRCSRSRGARREGELRGQLLVHVDAQARGLASPTCSRSCTSGQPGKTSRSFARGTAALLDAEVVGWPARGRAGRRGRPARRRPGRARPCAPRRTRDSAATLRAMLRPPICETWTRMKSIRRPAISGTYSCWLLNSSPMAMGMLVCWPQDLEVLVLLGREGVFDEEEAVPSPGPCRAGSPRGRVTRSWTSCSSSTSSPSFFRMCSKSCGTIRT